MVKMKGLKINIKPVQNRVVVRQEIAEEVSEGGILLPENAKQKPLRGTVLFAGLGKITEEGKRVPMDIKVGDTVYWAQIYGMKVKTTSGEELIVLKEDEVLFAVEVVDE